MEILGKLLEYLHERIRKRGCLRSATLASKQGEVKRLIEMGRPTPGALGQIKAQVGRRRPPPGQGTENTPRGALSVGGVGAQRIIC